MKSTTLRLSVPGIVCTEVRYVVTYTYICLGRTGPFCHYSEDDEEYGIMYLDFDSLYPSVNYDGDYMMGHPIAMKYNENVVWEKSSDMIDPKTKIPFRGGWYQVRLTGPRGLRVGVSYHFQ